VPPHEGQHTTHYTVADRWRNVAAVTYTLNDLFGAKVTAAGTGVLLNDSMDDFSALPGGPNAIAPGKRPLSSMTPTLLTQNGKTIAALGSPGGSRIITAVLHTILNLIDYGMDVQEAVDAPRFHQEWLPQATSLEAFSLSPDTREILQGWGHQFTSAPPANHLAAILLGAPTLGGPAVCRKRFFGANDPRGNTGLALGY
jgi:gamma-glutamyltranspeptidase/glutathione hydrolase